YLTGGTAGQPNIHISNMIQSGAYAGGSEPIININACDTVTLENLEVLNVTGQTAYQVSAGSNVTIINCRVEVYTTANNVPIINMPDSSGTITNFAADGLIATATNGQVLNVSGGAAAHQVVTVNNLSVSAVSGTGTVALFTSNNALITCVSPPNSVNGVGSGPAILQLTNTASTASVNWLKLLTYQGGEMSDDIGNAGLTFFGWGPSGTPTAHVNVW